MSTIAALVFFILLLCLAQIKYNEERLPKAERVFKDAKYLGELKWLYEVDWSYMCLFSMEKVAKAIYMAMKKDSAGTFKIGNDTLVVSASVSKKQILYIVDAYNYYLSSKYDKNGEKTVIEIAKDIVQQEEIYEEDAIIKAIWLIYGEEDAYRNVFKRVARQLFKERKITKDTLEKLSTKYLQQ